MATIQFRRQLKFAHSKNEAIQYIREKITMASGEPIVCTYKNPNGKWGSFEAICVYEKGLHKSKTTLLEKDYKDYIDENGNLKCNVIKVLDGEWESI